jgi:phosphoribosyl-ATP pyrophosphohydrolase
MPADTRIPPQMTTEHALHTLDRLATIIERRREAQGDASYTRQLLDAGAETCARKFGEEAIELIVAALGADPLAIRAEAADVLYHLLVVLESKGVPLRDVLSVLETRIGTSGIAEKAARSSAGQ